jgi:hypothetical protein
MSVTIPHAAYQAMLPLWQAYRDAYLGEQAVKNARELSRSQRGQYTAGTRYLPRPSGMKRADQYAAYRDRPSWVGATERAVQGITGSIFRHEPQIVAPTALDPDLADITQTGVSLRMFSEQVVRETLLMGRSGLLVDFPPAEVLPDGRVLAPAPQSRPYWIGYQAEEIINWRTLQRNGDTILSLVVLRECLPDVQGPWGSDDFFVTLDRVQYRVLRLNEAGQYEVSLWREVSTTLGQVRGGVALTNLWVPLRQGQPLDFIPFVFLAPFSIEPAIEKSLLDALIHRNFLCWRHSADYEHALHLTAMPTFYVSANMEAPPELFIGAGTALMLPHPATVGLVEFHGQGLGPHETVLKQDLELMAMFGASILQGTPVGQETATSVQWRMSGSDAPVQSLVSIVSQALTWALQTHAWWKGVTENVDDPAIHMTLNKDLVSNVMPPQQLQALMQALLNGTISFETWYYNLQRGEIARPLIDVEDEQALIDDQQAQRPLVMLPPGPGTLPPAPGQVSAGRNGTARVTAA